MYFAHLPMLATLLIKKKVSRKYMKPFTGNFPNIPPLHLSAFVTRLACITHISSYYSLLIFKEDNY